jgi:hypothetical protein
MRRILVAAAAVLMLIVATGCEPAMTITASDPEHTTTCGYVMRVVGTVKPAAATKKVVLQWTSGGKWVDVKAYADQPPHAAPRSLRTGNVSQSSGNYTIPVYVDWFTVKHFRVRSAGSSAVSNDFYMKITASDGC